MILRSRILWKLYAGYSALIIISALIVWILVAQRIKDQSLDNITQSLHARALMLREIVRPALIEILSTDADVNVDVVPDADRDLNHALDLQKLIQDLGKDISTRLTVIKNDGMVLADSQEDPARMDNHGSRPEIMASKSHGQGIATRLSDTLGTNMMYLALPVLDNDGNNILGFVRTSLSLATIDAILAQLSAVVALGILLAALAALILGFILAQPFIKPLVTMTAVAKSMAVGDYEHKLYINRKDEIGNLAQALNVMSASYRKRMDTISQESNKLSTILAGMVEGIIAVDHEEKIVHINNAAEKLLNINAKTSIRRPVWEVLRITEICQILTDTMQQDKILKGKLSFTSRSGDLIMDMHASPLHDGQNQLMGAVLVLHDVSDLHRLDMVRRDFVANASHELKTPITAIQGLIETIIDDKEMDKETHDRFLEKTRNQAVRLSTIITDLLTISRLESASDGLISAPVDLCSTIKTAISEQAQHAENKGILLTRDLPELALIVKGDEKGLHQAISNLLDNALKYTPNAGHINISVHTNDENNTVEIAVQDNGIGIDLKDQERIFERFYRVDKARSRELGGTGLGLSIVRHIARVHGGGVFLESTPGKGSKFRIILPLAGSSIN